MNTVLAISLNGCLRIRASKTKGVVEIRSRLYPGDWIWCVYRSLPIDDAWKMFNNQCFHNSDTEIEVIDKGV